MAHIASGNDMTVLKIRSFLGLNENPDGDTTLKNGEMSAMHNFRITQDGHLQIRPGSRTVLDIGDDYIAEGEENAVYGVWRGTVAGVERLIVACGGKVFDVNTALWTATEKGTAASAETHFFGFGGKVYFLDGTNYKSWDGGALTSFADVTPYVPLVKTATAPQGNGTALENVNRLTGSKRVRFSPDGSSTQFQLPETGITSVDWVKLNGTTQTATTDYTVDLTNGKVTEVSAPASGVNTLEIQYTKGSGAPLEVKNMRYSEIYNGTNDTRVFLYGDGSNKAIYSGIQDSDGQPSADYFPDLYEIKVGDDNTPITALVRHYSKLLIFKTNSTWSCYYGEVTLADGNLTSAFYVTPVNRQFGNDAVGQVKLLENNPLTLDVGSIYQWKATSSYNSNIVNSENNAKRISDRVADSVKMLNVNTVRTFNMKADHEYWFLDGGNALILNYANNTWYRYKDIPFARLVEIGQEKYGVSSDGKIMHFSRMYRSDNGAALDCYAETGAMDFGRDWVLKYSPMLFVAVQPESGARITVTVETNRKSDYPEKEISYSLISFANMNFAHFSFSTNRKPQVSRLKIKAKKAIFYRIIYKSNSSSATATVIETDVKLRYAGDVK